MLIIFFLLGLILGWGIAFFYFRGKIQLIDEKMHFFQGMHQNFVDQFKGLTAEALKNNQTTFQDLAKSSLTTLEGQVASRFDQNQKLFAETMKPIRESLEKFDGKIQDLEKSRHGAYMALKEQIHLLVENEKSLRQETANLVQALRRPHVRGRWGELQLKRVVEMAGMIAHCDFEEQTHQTSDDGNLRPDLIIKLPNEKIVVVDAKTPLEAYLKAVECTEELTRLAFMQEHARHVKQHVQLLSRKSYWSQFPSSPEFVVLFLPGEAFFSAALEFDPELIEFGIARQVILATPTTLIALLRSVAYGWKQENLSRYVDEIRGLGQELYKRIADMGGHFAKVGKNLASAVQSYNKTVGSLESRVLTTARRFDELKTSGEIEELTPVEQMPRSLESVELRKSVADLTEDRLIAGD